MCQNWAKEGWETEAGPDQKVQRGGHFEELIFDGLMIMGKRCQKG